MKPRPLRSRRAKVDLAVVKRDEGSKVTGILVVEAHKESPSDNEELERDKENQAGVL